MKTKFTPATLRSLALASAFSLLAIGAGCNSGGEAQQINPLDRDQAITQIGRIDPSEANEAALDLVSSMLADRTITGHNAVRRGGKVTLTVNSVRNETSDNGFDIDILNKTIRTELSKSGLVQTNVVMSNPRESQLSTEAKQEQDLLGDGPKPLASEQDLVLSGKITENYGRAGRTRQMVYYFQMSLIDPKTGIAVWEDQKILGTKGRRDNAGA